MIRLTRHLDPEGLPGEDARVRIACDLCGTEAPESGLCDPDDWAAAATLAEWLRHRCHWKRSGGKIHCPDCKRTPPPKERT